MNKIQLYIFNSSDKGAVYGIGTYIHQLRACLHKQVNITIINLYSPKENINFTEKGEYTYLEIPEIKKNPGEKINQYRYLKNVAYLLKTFIEDSDTPIIFHLNYLTSEYLAVYLKKLFNCKIILTVHYTNWSFDLLGDFNKLKTILQHSSATPYNKRITNILNADKRMMKHCDLLICVANHTSTYLKDVYEVPDERIEIINNALKDEYFPLSDLQKSAIKKKYSLTPKTKLILFAGRLDPVKGYHFLIEAFKKITNFYSNIHLVIAGSSDNQMFEFDKVNLSDKITFTGHLHKQDLYDLYQIAEIGVIPSLHEEFGYVAIEMMMHEIAVIVTDTGGLSEIVEHGVSGLKIPLTKKNNTPTIEVDMLAQNLIYLLDNPLITKKISKNARKRFLKHYHIDKFQQKMSSIYKDIYNK